jgi:hypothetical protein
MRISQAIESTLAPKVSHQKSVVAIEMLCNSKDYRPADSIHHEGANGSTSTRLTRDFILSVLHDVSLFHSPPCMYPCLMPYLD